MGKKDLALAVFFLLLGVLLVVPFTAAFVEAAIGTYRAGRLMIALAFGSGALVAVALGVGFIEALVKILLLLFFDRDSEVLISRPTRSVGLVGLLAALGSAFVAALTARSWGGALFAAFLLAGVALLSVKHFASVKELPASPAVEPIRKLGALPPIPAWFREEQASLPLAKRYQPNQISLGWRAFYTISALALLTYGSFGVWVDDLFVPGKPRHSVHLHGAAAFVMFGALVAWSAVLGSNVVDHYDRRDNERRYRAFAKVGSIVGWSLFVLAMLLGSVGR